MNLKLDLAQNAKDRSASQKCLPHQSDVVGRIKCVPSFKLSMARKVIVLTMCHVFVRRLQTSRIVFIKNRIETVQLTIHRHLKHQIHFIMLRFGSAKLVNCLRGLGEESVLGRKNNGEDLLVDWPSDDNKFHGTTSAPQQKQHCPEPDHHCVSCTMSDRSHERDMLLARLLQEHPVAHKAPGPSSLTRNANPCA